MINILVFVFVQLLLSLADVHDVKPAIFVPLGMHVHNCNTRHVVQVTVAIKHHAIGFADYCSDLQILRI